jgi:hypothetical protein
MKNQTLSFLSICALLGSVSCDDDNNSPCISGTVIGTNCNGAYLIQLASQTALGSNIIFRGDASQHLAGPPVALETKYDNVVETFSPLPANLVRGQQLFFSVRAATKEEKAFRICNAMVAWYTAPEVVLTNVSEVSCSVTPKE